MQYDFTPDEVQGMSLVHALLAEKYEQLAELCESIAHLHKTGEKAWLNMGRRQYEAIKKETQEIELEHNPDSIPDSKPTSLA